MLVRIAQRLDKWIVRENAQLRRQGLPQLGSCTFRVVGQAALLESGIPLTLAVTNDVDVRAVYAYSVEQEFVRLLAANHRTLDPGERQAWMPRETRYQEVFAGSYVKLLLAEPEAILLSKALKAPVKNKALIVEYPANGATERFMTLAQKYALDLEQFL